MKEVYDVLSEPEGEMYRKLMDYSLTACDTFFFVVQDFKWDDSARKIRMELNPFLQRKSIESEWPGTKLGPGPGGAVVYRYKLSPESVAILKNVAQGLYNWVQPRLPEDLCLLRPDGSPWLVTISHERDSYLELTSQEKDHLLAAIPELASMIRPASERGKKQA